ncbi:MAG: hypothetical protein ACP5D5_07490 [Acidithiobacillus sp.]|uniref:hypothetical protein n=1 Tax=Acidithiobacillus sp. TaxID=1872118 RepID=UPI0025C6DE88|nr:hypothetical protein [Acidithiobacillus sp.]
MPARPRRRLWAQLALVICSLGLVDIGILAGSRGWGSACSAAEYLVLRRLEKR